MNRRSQIDKHIREQMFDSILVNIIRYKALYLAVLIFYPLIIASHLHSGSVTYVNATVIQYAGSPGGTGVHEYLIMETENGHKVRVEMVGRPAIGSQAILAAHERLFMFGPKYSVYTPNRE